MLIPLLLIAFGLLAVVAFAVVARRRRREAEERAARTLSRLRHRRAALAARTAEVASEVSALYDPDAPRSATPSA